MTVSGEADSNGNSGKGILSAVMSRITGNTDQATDKAAAPDKPPQGAETKQENGEKKSPPEKKSVPELQASLPPVATR